MARFLFTVWPYPTHLHPFIALARELRSRGHETAFYSGGDGPALLGREGFRCFPFREVDWSRVARTVEDLIAGRRHPSQMRRLWSRFLVETVPAQVGDIGAVLAEWPADALICDIAMWAPILILHERSGIPVVPFSHVANCMLPGPDGPVQGIALPRRRPGPLRLLGSVAAQAVEMVTALTRRKANALRRASGLMPLRTGVNEFTGTLPLYLVPSVPEFDNHRRDLPPSVRYVGPCLWDKDEGQAPPAWLGDVPKDRPCVVVDEGALFTREPRVLELAARGLAGLPLTVLLLAGHGRDPARLNLGPLASNVMLQPNAPLSDVLPLASVFVTNGNSESVLAALQAGLPMAVLPSIWDQAELAWRVQETGVGLRLAPWRATPGRMRHAVERILRESCFRQKAVVMRDALARYPGPPRAANLIEDLVRSSCHVSGT
jgi:MGT family glycosyltransferase